MLTLTARMIIPAIIGVGGLVIILNVLQMSVLKHAVYDTPNPVVISTDQEQYCRRLLHMQVQCIIRCLYM